MPPKSIRQREFKTNLPVVQRKAPPKPIVRMETPLITPDKTPTPRPRPRWIEPDSQLLAASKRPPQPKPKSPRKQRLPQNPKYPRVTIPTASQIVFKDTVYIGSSPAEEIIVNSDESSPPTPVLLRPAQKKRKVQPRVNVEVRRHAKTPTRDAAKGAKGKNQPDAEPRRGVGVPRAQPLRAPEVPGNPPSDPNVPAGGGVGRGGGGGGGGGDRRSPGGGPPGPPPSPPPAGPEDPTGSNPFVMRKKEVTILFYQLDKGKEMCWKALAPVLTPNHYSPPYPVDPDQAAPDSNPDWYIQPGNGANAENGHHGHLVLESEQQLSGVVLVADTPPSDEGEVFDASDDIEFHVPALRDELRDE